MNSLTQPWPAFTLLGITYLVRNRVLTFIAWLSDFPVPVTMVWLHFQASTSDLRVFDGTSPLGNMCCFAQQKSDQILGCESTGVVCPPQYRCFGVEGVKEQTIGYLHIYIFCLHVV